MTLPPVNMQTLARAVDASPQIVARVRAAGIAGLGGGGYPTADKLESAMPASALIINGLQSEPDNLSDVALLQECRRDVMDGIALTAIACDAAHIVLAVPNTLHKALAGELNASLAAQSAWFEEHCGRSVQAQQILLPVTHGSGEEHQLAHTLGLIKALTPAIQAAPLTDQGVLCINLATSYAIARAVVHGEPLQRRMVTLNGEPLWLEFGTPIEKLQNPGWINGRASGTAAEPGTVVNASTFCISEPPASPSAPCINCGACASVCPANLQPQELFRVIELGHTPSERLDLQACIECGACNATCPSDLWLTQAFHSAKQEAQQEQHREVLARKAKSRVDARALRLSRIEQERKDRLSDRSTTQRRSW